MDKGGACGAVKEGLIDVMRYLKAQWKSVDNQGKNFLLLRLIASIFNVELTSPIQARSWVF